MGTPSTMLWKPSETTRRLFRRSTFAFLPVWLASALYLGARYVGWVSARWDKEFFFLFFVSFFALFFFGLAGLRSAYEDIKKSPHPDPDVAALIDGEIDISQYRVRKAARSDGVNTEQP